MRGRVGGTPAATVDQSSNSDHIQVKKNTMTVDTVPCQYRWMLYAIPCMMRLTVPRTVPTYGMVCDENVNFQVNIFVIISLCTYRMLLDRYLRMKILKIVVDNFQDIPLILEKIKILIPTGVGPT